MLYCFCFHAINNPIKVLILFVIAIFKGGGGVKSATSFFYNFNPTKWGRSSTTGRNSGCTSNSESPNSVNSSASSSSHVARLSRENLALPNLKKRDGNKEYRFVQAYSYAPEIVNYMYI